MRRPDEQQPRPDPGSPRGTALRLTEEQLADMSHVDAGDAVAAEALWKRYCPGWARALLRRTRQD